MFYDIAVKDLALYYKIQITNNYTCQVQHSKNKHFIKIILLKFHYIFKY